MKEQLELQPVMQQVVHERKETTSVALPTLAAYQNLRQAIIGIYRSGGRANTATEIFSRPSIESRRPAAMQLRRQHVPHALRGDYYTDVPLPYDIGMLDEQTFHRLVRQFGPDVMRAKMLSRNLMKTLRQGGQAFAIGGSCALETWQLKVLEDIIPHDRNFSVTDVAENMLHQVPYYTQVTGAMLAGSGTHTSIMYTEEFPWHLRLSEFGVADAESRAEELYQKIAQTVERRGKLVNGPDFRLYTIPFTALQLETNNFLEQWHAETLEHIPHTLTAYKPSAYHAGEFLASWVRYTYNGPHIQQLVREYMADVYGVEIPEDALHTRTKQLDHLREETYLFSEQHELSEKDMSRLAKYSVASALAIDAWQLRNQKHAMTAFIGFDDLAINGDIMHQTLPLAKGGKQGRERADIDSVLYSPLRLHSRNVAEHIEYLSLVAQGFATESRFQKARDRENAEKLRARAETIVRDCDRRFANAERTMQVGQLFDLLHASGRAVLTKEQYVKIAKNPKDLAKELKKAITNFVRVHKNLPVFASADREQSVVNVLSWLSSLDVDEQATGNVILHLPDAELAVPAVLKVVSEVLQREADELRQQAEQQQEAVQKAAHTPLLSVADLTLLQLPEPVLLPLADNILVSHAIQLSFDPDMAEFVKESYTISTLTIDTQAKKELLTKAMQQIYPKVAAYLRYIMEGGDYPNERWQQIYQHVLA